MSPQLATAIDELRQYLTRIGFQQVYKFLAGVNQYSLMPSLVTRHTTCQAEAFFDTVLAERPELALARCLLYGRPATRCELGEDSTLADALVAANLLGASPDGTMIVAADRQLISAFGLNLLIDRRIHFGGGIHEVYIGPDSYWMLYYLDAAAIRRDERAVDLCTGTGIAGLYMSLFCDRVLATDIDAAALELAQINRRLNGREDALKIRRQELHDTLGGKERFSLLTCNPPFVAFPPGLKATIYAHGTDLDGLGYLRTIIERLPDILNPGGSAYLVADLVGDNRGPHFGRELETFAEKARLDIDVYIDNVVPAANQIPAIAPFLQRLNPTCSQAEIVAEIETFQRNVLRVENYFMSTIRVRPGAANPGVRVMRRFSHARQPAEEAWPALLT